MSYQFGFFLLRNLSPTLMTKRSNYHWYFFSFVNTRDGIKLAIWFRVSLENWGDFTFKFPDPSSTIQFRFLVTLNLNKIKMMQEKYFHYIIFHISTSTKSWRALSLTSPVLIHTHRHICSTVHSVFISISVNSSWVSHCSKWAFLSLHPKLGKDPHLCPPGKRFLIEIKKKEKEVWGTVLCFHVLRNDPRGWCTAWFSTSGSGVRNRSQWSGT